MRTRAPRPHLSLWRADSRAAVPGAWTQVAAALRARGLKVGERRVRCALLRVDAANVLKRRNWMGYRRVRPGARAVNASQRH